MYERRELLPSQRNALFQAIRDAGMSPADFVLGPEYGEYMPVGPPDPPRVIHKPGGRWTGFYFEVLPAHATRFELEVSPGSSVMVENYVAESWDAVRRVFDLWLELVARESTEPDLWSGVLSAPPSDSDASRRNDPFTVEERADIRAQIDAARRYLDGQALPADRLADANAKLDYLVEAAERVGRWDWRLIAMGIVIDIGINTAFNPEQAKTLLQLLIENAPRLLGQ